MIFIQNFKKKMYFIEIGFKNVKYKTTQWNSVVRFNPRMKWNCSNIASVRHILIILKQILRTRRYRFDKVQKRIASVAGYFN